MVRSHKLAKERNFLLPKLLKKKIFFAFIFKFFQKFNDLLTSKSNPG